MWQCSIEGRRCSRGSASVGRHCPAGEGAQHRVAPIAGRPEVAVHLRHMENGNIDMDVENAMVHRRQIGGFCGFVILHRAQAAPVVDARGVEVLAGRSSM